MRYKGGMRFTSSPPPTNITAVDGNTYGNIFLDPRNSSVECRTDSTTIKSHVYVQVKYSVDNNSWEPRVVHCLLEESCTMNVAETIKTRIDNNKYTDAYIVCMCAVRLGI